VALKTAPCAHFDLYLSRQLTDLAGGNVGIPQPPAPYWLIGYISGTSENLFITHFPRYFHADQPSLPSAVIDTLLLHR
ncbi:hypothetical protein, partial [Dyella sp. SG562]|uniref:hypothetical protein n=1 Tax=Dyella sp. SG562 TaxID=2587017 RepID=UPI001ABA0D6C